MAVAKRRGRPTRSGEEAATKMLTVRMRPNDYEELRAEAEAEGRSISAQAERRLLEPPVGELGRLVDRAVRAVEVRAGKSWQDGPEMRARARAVADTVLTLLLGAPLDEKVLRSFIKAELERAERHETGPIGALSLLLERPVDHSALQAAASRLLEIAEDQFKATAIVNKARER